MYQQMIEHYYGDQVRRLFIFAGLIMIVSYPFFRSLISVPLPVSVSGSIVLAVLGGLMNPKHRLVILASMIISIVAFPFFQYSAVFAYINLSPKVGLNLAFFWVNQVLSIIFFLSAYFATKTFRGLLLSSKNY